MSIRSFRPAEILFLCVIAGSVDPAVANPDAPAPADTLAAGFKNPPASARPRVYWHWMNGNVTKEGIKLDLEWMQRVGIGGVQNVDAALTTPQVVERRLAYMTPEWTDALRYAVDLAEEHGVEMTISSSPGWSLTGGPWVKPEQAMKKLVWSETQIAGGRRYASKLPRPPAVTGPFQDLPKPPEFSAVETTPASVEFYADIAVIAYPVVRNVSQAREPSVRTTKDSLPIDAALLSDGALTRSLQLKFGTAENPACLLFDYHGSATISAALLAIPIGTDFFHSPTARPVLEASDDAVSFSKVAGFPAGSIVQHTISFPAVTARYFRVCFSPPPPRYTDLLDAVAPGANIMERFRSSKSPEAVEIYELRLLSTPRVHRAEEKAGFAFVADYYAIPTPPVDARDAVTRADVLDLTGLMKPDGTLDWTPPPGRWKVLRLGYSLTGKGNHPATPEATGLEVDKLDRGHVRAYLDEYLGKYESAVGRQRLGAKGIRGLLVDSIEVGAQNWTESLPAEFQRRRGYSLLQWMPALTGVIVGSAEQTDAFLYDFRRTIGELIVDHHYGQIAQSAKERGLTQYGEALEQGRPILGDDMDMRRHADVPMAAMWTYSAEAGAPTPVRFADIRGAASVAHIYGQNLVGAESLTSAFAPWASSPRDLKAMMDLEFVLGVNRPVIHTSVHQPLLDRTPGLTLLIFGQYFNRNETWAEQAGPWMSYLARASHLLQQGWYVADVLYFYGEETPLTALYRDHVTTDIPTGHGFDFANADVVLNRIEVEDGALVTKSGMRYQVLYLGGTSQRMTLPVLRRIRQLVDRGATIVGNRPLDSPSLADDPNEFAALTAALWDRTAVLKGRVIQGADIDAALASLGVPRDFEYRKAHADSDIMFLHRRLPDGELYFLTNRKPREEIVEASFRVAGKRPEIWRAETGRSEPVSYRVENGRTFISLPFAAHDAFFVVFRAPAGTGQATVGKPVATELAMLTDDWTVSFQTGRGGPVTPQRLRSGSWSEHANPAIRYFSGTATYSRSFSAPSSWTKGAGRIVLDLGEVRELAEVLINGRSLGILWYPPYRVDVTDALRTGSNRLEVRVTNLWVNRLIGDAQPGAQKVTFTTFQPYRADAPLRPSGLLGPVRVEQVRSD